MCQFVMYISGGGTKTPSQNYSHYFSCLTAFLSLRSFIFLISNCLNLLFATQRKPRRLKSNSTNMKWDMEGAFEPRRALKGAAQGSVPSYL